ncbi:hypothetical protein [Flagellimonas lutaonensis]|nr:hypothetical protein [Allomuricauda lutaonensis]
MRKYSMKKVLAVIIIALCLFVSCSNDEIGLTDTNYLVFGHFYGECVGEGCVETYKLTKTKLFEDTIDDYSGKELNFIELEHRKFEQVKDLIDFFPSQLFLEKGRIFGCPDCADGGGLFIQYSQNGNVKSWRIEQNKDNVPSYLHEFMDQVNEKIRLINN